MCSPSAGKLRTPLEVALGQTPQSQGGSREYPTPTRDVWLCFVGKI